VLLLTGYGSIINVLKTWLENEPDDFEAGSLRTSMQYHLSKLSIKGDKYEKWASVLQSLLVCDLMAAESLPFLMLVLSAPASELWPVPCWSAKATVAQATRRQSQPGR
jgi:hypothetical protein